MTKGKFIQNREWPFVVMRQKKKTKMVDHHSLKIRTHTKSFLKRKWDEKLEIKGTIKCVRFDLL